MRLLNVRTIAFDIPSEPLAEALQDFSQRSGVELLYESAITTGLKSPALKGSFTPRDALRQLLAGTGFIVHYNLHNAVSLSLPTAASWAVQQDLSMGNASLSLNPLNVVAGDRPDDEQLREFGEALQNDVSAALTKNTDVRSGNYRIRVKLWIDPSRAIRRAEVTETTGDFSARRGHRRGVGRSHGHARAAFGIAAAGSHYCRGGFSMTADTAKAQQNQRKQVLEFPRSDFERNTWWTSTFVRFFVIPTFVTVFLTSGVYWLHRLPSGAPALDDGAADVQVRLLPALSRRLLSNLPARRPAA